MQVLVAIYKRLAGWNRVKFSHCRFNTQNTTTRHNWV